MNGRNIGRYKKNIARGTTDPGYWVYNLNHVSDWKWFKNNFSWKFSFKLWNQYPGSVVPLAMFSCCIMTTPTPHQKPDLPPPNILFVATDEGSILCGSSITPPSVRQFLIFSWWIAHGDLNTFELCSDYTVINHPFNIINHYHHPYM